MDEIAGATQVLANGGDVKVLDFVDGVSTTGIIDAMTNKQGDSE